MVGSFRLVNTNSVAVFNLIRLSNSPFRFWIRFLTEYPNVPFALTADAVLNHYMLRECYCSAYKSTDNEVSSFPERNFASYPTTLELFNFLNAISYHVDETLYVQTSIA